MPQNKEYLELADKVIKFSLEVLLMFTSKEKYRDIPQYKMTLFQIFANATSLFFSIETLCVDKQGQPALIILRPLLENLITCKYIVFLVDDNWKNHMALRFESYRWVELHKILKKQQKMKTVWNKTVIKNEEEIVRKFEDFKSSFKIKNSSELSTWSGVSLEKMAERTYMLPDYLVMYKDCCLYAHANFLGFHFDEDEDGDIHPTLDSPNEVPNCLGKAICYYLDFLYLIDLHFDLKIRKNLHPLRKKSEELF